MGCIFLLTFELAHRQLPLTGSQVHSSMLEPEPGLGTPLFSLDLTLPNVTLILNIKWVRLRTAMHTQGI